MNNTNNKISIVSRIKLISIKEQRKSGCVRTSGERKWNAFI